MPERDVVVNLNRTMEPQTAEESDAYDRRFVSEVEALLARYPEDRILIALQDGLITPDVAADERLFVASGRTFSEAQMSYYNGYGIPFDRDELENANRHLDSLLQKYPDRIDLWIESAPAEVIFERDRATRLATEMLNLSHTAFIEGDYENAKTLFQSAVTSYAGVERSQQDRFIHQVTSIMQHTDAPACLVAANALSSRIARILNKLSGYNVHIGLEGTDRHGQIVFDPFHVAVRYLDIYGEEDLTDGDWAFGSYTYNMWRKGEIGRRIYTHLKAQRGGEEVSPDEVLNVYYRIVKDMFRGIIEEDGEADVEVVK